ncbi:MAG: hypothetical protein ACLRMJ_06780 [Alistipes finegoldii]
MSILAKQQALTERFGITDPEYLAEAYSNTDDKSRKVDQYDRCGRQPRFAARNHPQPGAVQAIFRRRFDASSHRRKENPVAVLTLPESLHLLPH